MSPPVHGRTPPMTDNGLGLWRSNCEKTNQFRKTCASSSNGSLVLSVLPSVRQRTIGPAFRHFRLFSNWHPKRFPYRCFLGLPPPRGRRVAGLSRERRRRAAVSQWLAAKFPLSRGPSKRWSPRVGPVRSCWKGSCGRHPSRFTVPHRRRTPPRAACPVTTKPARLQSRPVWRRGRSARRRCCPLSGHCGPQPWEDPGKWRRLGSACMHTRTLHTGPHISTELAAGTRSPSW